MKMSIKVLSIFMSCIFMIMNLITINVQAHNHSSYSHETTSNLSKEYWMSQLPDWIKLSDITLPGTSNSLADEGSDYVKFQTLNLQTQLKAGIRFLDLDFVSENDFGYSLSVGKNSLSDSVGEVVTTITEFLTENTSETILIQVELFESNDSYAIKDLIEWLGEKITEDYEDILFDATQDQNPTLKDVRGKIVLLSSQLKDTHNGVITLNKDNSSIQNTNNFSTNWDLYDKWFDVKNQTNSTTTYMKKEENQTETIPQREFKIFINDLSGSGTVVFPYFIASGHSSSGTSADRLLTGLTEPAFKGQYPDFPRVGKFLFFSSIAFEGVNTLFQNYVDSKKTRFLGWVLAAFPGDGLIETIININFKKDHLKDLEQEYNNFNSDEEEDDFGFTFKGSEEPSNGESLNGDNEKEEIIEVDKKSEDNEDNTENGINFDYSNGFDDFDFPDAPPVYWGDYYDK